MGWSIGLTKFDRVYRNVDEIPRDARPHLGSASTVRACLDAGFAGIDWSDPAHGRWKCNSGSLQFMVGADEDVGCLGVLVRAGDGVVPSIIQLCRDHGWQALDFDTGEFFERSATPAAGLAASRARREKIVNALD